jgi:hypothetical protein
MANDILWKTTKCGLIRCIVISPERAGWTYKFKMLIDELTGHNVKYPAGPCCSLHFYYHIVLRKFDLKFRKKLNSNFFRQLADILKWLRPMDECRQQLVL